MFFSVMREQCPNTKIGMRFPMEIENHSFRKAERPLVSVIVALYNGGKFIQGLLEDLEAQTIAKAR